MALKHHPAVRAIVICDYSGFTAPEMVKRRLRRPLEDYAIDGEF